MSPRAAVSANADAPSSAPKVSAEPRRALRKTLRILDSCERAGAIADGLLRHVDGVQDVYQEVRHRRRLGELQVLTGFDLATEVSSGDHRQRVVVVRVA